jgi:hypothetical protein
MPLRRDEVPKISRQATTGTERKPPLVVMVRVHQTNFIFNFMTGIQTSRVLSQ